MVKDYSHRLEEWIQYNLNIGISGIVVFNNDKNNKNNKNKTNESITNNLDSIIKQNGSTHDICLKFNDENILEIKFPYLALKNCHWGDNQRLLFNLICHVFKYQCKFICLIDADEFISYPNIKNINISDYLKSYHQSLRIQNHIITNKKNNEIINNNVLKIAKYINVKKKQLVEDHKLIIYTKDIIYPKSSLNHQFFASIHFWQHAKLIEKNKLLYYHTLLNERYSFKKNMKKITII